MDDEESGNRGIVGGLAHGIRQRIFSGSRNNNNNNNNVAGLGDMNDNQNNDNNKARRKRRHPFMLGGHTLGSPWYKSIGNLVTGLLTRQVAWSTSSCWVFTASMFGLLLLCFVAIYALVPTTFLAAILLPPGGVGGETPRAITTSNMAPLIMTTTVTATVVSGGGGLDLNKVQELVIVAEACSWLTRVSTVTGQPAGRVSLNSFMLSAPTEDAVRVGPKCCDDSKGGDVKLNNDDDDDDDPDDYNFVCPRTIIAYNEMRANVDKFLKRPRTREVWVSWFGKDWATQSDAMDDKR